MRCFTKEWWDAIHSKAIGLETWHSGPGSGPFPERDRYNRIRFYACKRTVNAKR